MKNIFFIILFLMMGFLAVSQVNTETKPINEYLSSTVKYTDKLIVNSSVQSLIKSDILEAGLSVNIGDKYNDALILSSYFISVDGKLIPFESRSAILSSPEFIELIKNNKFKLKTEENAIALQTLLCLIDNNDPLGYFKIDKTWYFVREEWFGDIKAYEIITDKKSNIISIKYHSDLKKDIPESFSAVNKKEKFGRIKDDVSKEDSSAAYNYLSQKANYTFSSAKVELPIDTKEASASIYYCGLESTEIYQAGDQCTTNYSFMLMSNNGKYQKFKDGKAVTESDLFSEDILKSIKINNEEDAKAFQGIIDIINPVDNSFRILKKFYLQDGIWFFLRDKSFDDLYGYMVKTDETGAIKFVDYSTITDEDLLRFKMRADDFIVDYKFKLEKPSTNKITLERGEGLRVEISFDADMVNAKGAWIMTRFDGHNHGMYASTTMESPFTDGITGMSLENSNHTFEYFLLKNGSEDTEDALGKIKIEIKVE